jgi:phenylalanyl-tRNA synthetase beta subunit
MQKTVESRRVINAMLNGYGFNEVVTYSLSTTSKCRCWNSIQLVHRLESQMLWERIDDTIAHHYLPSLLDCVSYNVARGNS